jgi:hypothetical protein
MLCAGVVHSASSSHREDQILPLLTIELASLTRLSGTTGFLVLRPHHLQRQCHQHWCFSILLDLVIHLQISQVVPGRKEEKEEGGGEQISGRKFV